MRMVHCVKLNKEAEGLDRPPVGGALGQRIHEQVSREAWQQWLALQTMLINEHRLIVIEPEAKRFLAEQMERFFFGSPEEAPAAPHQEKETHHGAQE